ncbi:aminoglycoside adenylyltransferase family protein [Paracoccus simplex]|uniref:Aminoglycoside (3'') (9) adenylyltransferase n=1 Tax=Paracoccus simplex TaxID=2086346 RepID=A0ABV7S3M7_9RHOB
MQTTPRQTKQIRSTLDILHRSLGDALIGAYLHGSLVSGGLRPQSDIDLLAVVESGLSESQRHDLLAGLLRLSGRHPAAPGGARCLEVIIFRRSDLAGGDYPARAEFVYGEWLRDAFEAGETPMPDRNPEYSLVIAQARRQAIPLFGPPGDELLAEIPPGQVRQAMRDALPDLLDGLHGDERNVLLTLARMWHTACTGRFVAKDVAAGWAIARLSGQRAATLDHARRAYLGEIADDWSSQDDAARRLAAHMGEQVAGSL